MPNPTDDEVRLDSHVRSLKQALDEAKNREADRNDVVVDLKAAERARLELLAEELRPLFSEIDDSDERFDFALTKGERPRLWIDMTSFVAMGHDKRYYRFLKDTRMGRIVLAETDDMSKAADIVSQYVAEKVLERERALDGEWVSLKDNPLADKIAEPTKVAKSTMDSRGKAIASAQSVSGIPKNPGRWQGILWFIFGAILSVATIAALAFLVVPDAF